MVRSHELSLLLEDLRGNITAPSCQHILVVGLRGSGKTTLLARTAAELRNHGELAEALLPVRFMEESQEIFTLTDFWLETIYKLRRERDEAVVVETLIRFMVACYRVDDLWKLSGPLTAEAAESGTLRRGIGRAFRHRPHVVAEPSAGSTYDDILQHEKWRAIQQVSDQS